MSYDLYLITNKANGRQYVGMTTMGVPVRWASHCRQARNPKRSPLHLSIAKHGPDGFVVEHVACAFDLESMALAEADLIRQYGTQSPNGYNMTSGGEGALNLAPDSRQKIREKLFGYVRPLATRQKIAASQRARVRSPEHQARLTEAIQRSHDLGRRQPVARAGAAMTGEEFLSVLMRLELAVVSAARFLGTSEFSLRKWIKEDRVPSPVARAVEAWTRLADAGIEWRPRPFIVIEKEVA